MGCAGTRPRKSFELDDGAALAIGLEDVASEEAAEDVLAIGEELAMLVGDVETLGAFLQPAATTTKTARRRIVTTSKEYTPA